MINAIFPHQLGADYLFTHIYPDMEHDFYWSQFWDAQFYLNLACAGFISVTTIDEGEAYLLPQIQRSYAVLDWANLHISKKIKKLVSHKSLQGLDCQLIITKDIEAVMAGIVTGHGEESWMINPYQDMLRNLTRLETNIQFDLVSVEQRCGPDKDLIAGELGYSIGSVYTSLSGFLDRKHTQANHMGTVQLLALASLLKQAGYHFWNLGHPHMQYKANLGAKTLVRNAFLRRWYQSTATGMETSLTSFAGQSLSAQGLLEQCFL